MPNNNHAVNTTSTLIVLGILMLLSIGVMAFWWKRLAKRRLWLRGSSSGDVRPHRSERAQNLTLVREMLRRPMDMLLLCTATVAVLYLLYIASLWVLPWLPHRSNARADVQNAHQNNASGSRMVLWAKPEPTLSPLWIELWGEMDGNASAGTEQALYNDSVVAVRFVLADGVHFLATTEEIGLPHVIEATIGPAEQLKDCHRVYSPAVCATWHSNLTSFVGVVTTREYAIAWDIFTAAPTTSSHTASQIPSQPRHLQVNQPTGKSANKNINSLWPRSFSFRLPPTQGPVALDVRLSTLDFREATLDFPTPLAFRSALEQRQAALSFEAAYGVGKVLVGASIGHSPVQLNQLNVGANISSVSAARAPLPVCNGSRALLPLMGTWDANLAFFRPLRCRMRSLQRGHPDGFDEALQRDAIEGRWVAFYGDVTLQSLFNELCAKMNAVQIPSTLGADQSLRFHACVVGDRAVLTLVMFSDPFDVSTLYNYFALNLTSLVAHAGGNPHGLRLNRYNLKSRVVPDRVVLAPGIVHPHRLTGRTAAMREALALAMPSQFEDVVVEKNSGGPEPDNDRILLSADATSRFVVVALQPPIGLDGLLHSTARTQAVNSDILRTFPASPVADLYNVALLHHQLGQSPTAIQPATPALLGAQVDVVLSALWRLRH